MKHVTVYREAGRYGGWPANYGIWSWGSEIVFGFQGGYLKQTPGSMHPIDREKPRVTMLGRSLDGGETWEVTEPRLLAHTENLTTRDALSDCPGGVDFAHPDFALMCSRTADNDGPFSWYHVSYDRWRTWNGPYRFPDFGRPGIAARTDYQRYGRDECLLFLTAMKSNNREGRVFCARTHDGAASWRFVSWIGGEPAGFSIMPASVKLPDGRILVAIRRREQVDDNFIDLYSGDEEGHDWHLAIPRLADCGGSGGNPPAMIRLSDGRICLTHGYRSRPFGIRAIVSRDDGATWSDPIILRQDGGDPDLGYPRTVQRPDGKVITLYYFNDRPEGERYIAATIWED